MRPLIAALVATCAVAAQTPQVRDAARPSDSPTRSGTAAISGTITTDENPARPLRRVTVTIAEDVNMRGGRTTVTDDTGRFAFAELPSGRFLVSAVKAPYLKTAYGATRLSRPGSDRTGTAIVLADGQRVTNVNMRMTRSSVITGTVRDGTGRPVRGVRINVFYYRLALATGERTLAGFTPMDSPESTDSRGVYRIYGLPPGEYVIGASMSARDASNLEPLSAEDLQRIIDAPRAVAGPPPASRGSTPRRRPTVGYAPVYYPGTPVSANASPIKLEPGEERTGIDLQMQLVPNAFVQGTISRPDGLPATGAQAVLLNAGPPVTSLAGSTDASGRYVIRGVPPGSFTLMARYSASPAAGAAAASPPAAAPIMWGESNVDVQGDDVEVNVGLQPGAGVTGIVRFQATSATVPLDIAKVRLSFRDANSARGLTAASAATIEPSGRFRATGLSPGLQRLAATLPAGWVLASATLGGEDVIDRGFVARPGTELADLVVTFTDRVSEISGSLVDAGGRPAPEYYIIAFPANESLWAWQSRRIQQTRPSHDGKYAFKGLPAGDYLVAAVTDVDEGEWFDAAFLRAISGAALKISLADGERKTQSMQVK